MKQWKQKIQWKKRRHLKWGMLGLFAGICLCMGRPKIALAKEGDVRKEESSASSTTSWTEPENPQQADDSAPRILWRMDEKDISGEEARLIGTENHGFTIVISEKEENDLGIAEVVVQLGNSMGNVIEKTVSHEEDGCKEEIVLFTADELASLGEGRLQCEVKAQDRVGMVSVEKKSFLYDTTPPKIALTYSEPSGVDKWEQTRRMFYAQKMEMNIAVLEDNPDVNAYFAELLYSVTGEEASFEAVPKTVYWEKDPSGAYKAMISAEAGVDPDGYYKLRVRGTDRAGNVAQYEGDVKILESGQVSVNVDPTMRAAAYTEEGMPLYAGAVRFLVNATDQAAFEGSVRAGIEEVSCDLLAEGEYVWKNRTLYVRKEEEEAKEQYSVEIVIPSTNRTESNQLKLIVHAVDVAGNEKDDSSENVFDFGIDTTGPRITVKVTNDDVRHDRYFHAGRMALVREEDRNPAESVGIQADGAIIGSVQTESSHGNCVRSCTVMFEKDGEYTLEVSATDALGNPAQVVYQGVAPRSFCIDTIAPTILVNYDENEAQHGFFFNRARTAYVKIADSNVEAAGIKALVNGEKVRSDTVTEGTVTVFPIYFGEDGAYRLVVTCEDLAGNRSVVWRGERFVIDKTPPIIRLLGMDRTEILQEKPDEETYLSMSDAHLCTENSIIALRNCTTGSRPEFYLQENRSDQQILYKMPVIPHTKSEDGIYKMKVVAEDLAGNKAMYEDDFVVTRFEPTYRIEGNSQTARIAQSGYFTGEDVEILEKVLTWEEEKNRSVFLYCGNQLQCLREGREYTVESLQTEGYRQNRIVIRGENFQRDGQYNLVMGGKKVLSARTDQTPPSAEIVGIDLNTHHFLAQEITFSVIPYDNQALERITLRVSDLWNHTLQEQTIEGEDLDRTLARCEDKIPITISEQKGWQYLEISLEDAAGNQTALLSRKDNTAYRVMVKQETGTYYIQLFLLFGIVVAIGVGLTVGIRVYKSTLA